VLKHVLNHIKQLLTLDVQWLLKRFARWTQPLSTPFLLATAVDLFRSKPQLVAENALLRQQLIVLRRQIKRPVYGKTDRLLLVLLASMLDMRVSKRTIQKYMSHVRPTKPRGQNWKTFLRDHAAEV
jgi:hypothetical protein